MRPILFLLFFIPAVGFSQKIPPNNLKYIFGITQYRNELISGNREDLLHLKLLLKKWNRFELSAEDRDFFIFNALYLKREHYSFKAIKRKFLKYFPHPDFVNAFTEEDLEIMSNNSHMMDLINSGILELDYPFVIEPETDFFGEMDFYGLDNGMRVAEIGAGSGQISTLVGIIFERMQIFINEKDFFAIDYIENKIKNCHSLNPTNRMVVVKGKAKTGNLEGLELDKIFIRNSFHHFSKKEAMLASIKLSLKSNGELFLLENVMDFHNEGENYCSRELKLADIKMYLRKAGFRLVGDLRLKYHAIILKYVID